MKTTLNADGQIGIPQRIRDADQLAAGDSFHLERLTAGYYLLAKQASGSVRFTVKTGADGLPLIRVNRQLGLITSRLVKELDSQIP